MFQGSNLCPRNCNSKVISRRLGTNAGDSMLEAASLCREEIKYLFT